MYVFIDWLAPDRLSRKIENRVFFVSGRLLTELCHRRAWCIHIYDMQTLLRVSVLLWFVVAAVVCILKLLFSFTAVPGR